MKKIIIVGHNQENNEKLETLFQHFGMKKALPSRREGLTPIQVGELLNKAIKSQTPQIQEIDEEELPKKLPTHISKRRLKKNLKKQQNTPAASALPKSMWDYIPMDLMIANIDNEFWGWADKDAVDLLEYWKELDPSFYFVLVYDRPHELLFDNKQDSFLEMGGLKQKLEDWLNYNKKLLSFFEKNKDRAFLISNQKVNSQKEILEDIYNKIDAPYQESFDKELFIDNKNYHNVNNLSELVISDLIRNNLEVSEFYDKLQNIASFPNEDSKDQLSISLKAYNELIYQKKEIDNQKKHNKELIIDIENKLKEKETFLDKINLLNKENNKIEDENEELLSQLNFLEKELKEKETIEEENKILIENIFESQTEIEKQIAFNNRLKIEKEKLYNENEEIFSQIEFLRSNLNFIDNGKRTLEEENSLLKDQNSHFYSELGELTAQLHFMQNELELIEKENKRLKTKPLLWGAENRIRNQLTYRLGFTLVNSYQRRFGWLILPFSLLKTYCEYRRDFALSKWEKLPPIEKYADFKEADKLKKQLSYKVGQSFLKSIRNPFRWFIMPFEINKEIKNFRK